LQEAIFSNEDSERTMERNLEPRRGDNRMKRIVEVVQQSKSCDCKEPKFAPPVDKLPFHRGDGTYFRYCLKCGRFKNVEKERTI